MAVRDSVRDVKRRLADLDARHARAVAKLNRASARRSDGWKGLSFWLRSGT